MFRGGHRKLVRSFPIGARTHPGFKHNLKLRHVGHEFRQAGFHDFQFGLRHFQHRFIVHLHDHPALQFVCIQPALHGNHGQIDEICSGALHGLVDGGGRDSSN